MFDKFSHSSISPHLTTARVDTNPSSNGSSRFFILANFFCSLLFQGSSSRCYYGQVTGRNRWFRLIKFSQHCQHRLVGLFLLPYPFFPSFGIVSFLHAL